MASVTATLRDHGDTPVVYLVAIPLHQAVELVPWDLRPASEGGQDPQEAATKGLLDPVRFEGFSMAHDGAPVQWFSRSPAVLS